MCKYRLRKTYYSCTLQNTDNENNYNVKDVWRMNYTGDGVVVAVVDEGLSQTHPELRKNYVSLETIMNVPLNNCINNVHEKITRF